MPSKDHVEKSCDSQLLPAGDPTSEWGLDHLGVYAQLQYRQIMDGEKSLTATYRRLGCALVHTKKIFKHGCWGQHLKLLGIDRTRAFEGHGDLPDVSERGRCGGIACG